mgnify:FL=1
MRKSVERRSKRVMEAMASSRNKRLLMPKPATTVRGHTDDDGGGDGGDDDDDEVKGIPMSLFDHCFISV